MPTWPVAGGSLLLGFAVAQASGVRALGGAVLLVGAAWCVVRWRRAAGSARAAGFVCLFLVAFVASHLLAGAVGAWGSVTIVAAIVSVVVFAAADRRRRSSG